MNASSRHGPSPDRLLIVSGLSGAGKSSAMKALEDLGYDAIDNLPLSMVWQLAGDWAGAERPMPRQSHGLAIGVDSRTREFSPGALTGLLNRLRARADMAVEVLFLDCDDELLFRRFTETRRRHPMAPAGARLRDAVAAERAAMAGLRAEAGQIIDTTELSTHDLRALIGGYYALGGKGLAISVVSFSYRRGLPREADLVLDVRFLKNPHYAAELRPQSGLDAGVGAFISSDTLFGATLESFGQLAHSLMDGYTREGKSYLTIAVGCTGGRHRSVYFTERLAEYLLISGHRVDVRHRDIGAG